MGMYGGHYVYCHNDVNEYKYGMDDDYYYDRYRNDNDGIDDDRTDYDDDCYGD